MSDTAFINFLRQHRGGELAGELSDVVAAVTAACLEHDKKGSITLTIRIAPSGDGSTVFVTDELKKVVPEDRGGNIMFTDREGNLYRRNPNQMSMPSEIVGVTYHPAAGERPDTDLARVSSAVGRAVVDMQTGEVIG